jgi:threonylcarbamoyladenosine tRNA methylthiotransferase MtaB
MNAPVEVVTFGCRLNAAESERVRALASARSDDRPTIVLNTCAVTTAAERDARRMARKLKRERPDADIVVTGCAAQRDPAQFAAMPEVARIVGNREKLRPETWTAPGDARVVVGDIMSPAPDAPAMPETAAATGTRAVVEAQQGCDHRCTFCIIPFTRGPSRSEPLGALAARIAALCAAGTREVVLSGVDLASYGHDLPGRPGLGRAVRRLLANLPQLPRLRLSSIDPAEIDDDLVTAFAAEERLMPYAHLSVQSGDDLILKRMRRRHSRAQAIAIAVRLRRARPDIAFGADLIAGFPTESPEAAAASLRILDEMDIAFVHAFAFDPRPGTPAARMPKVPAAEVAARAAALRAAGRTRLRSHLEARVGHELDILVESEGTGGHAADFTRVRLDHPARRGTLLRARACAAAADHLIATTRAV